MAAPVVIFCSDPLDPRSVEPDFAYELEPARLMGFNASMLDHDYLDRQIEPARALRKARFNEAGRAVYRGWMLTVEAYAALFAELIRRGIELLTKPEQYEACHHALGSYERLAEWMPRTTWLSLEEVDDVSKRNQALTQFGTSPLIIKDWVKSQATGYWEEACYIADASQLAEVARVVDRFREIQGESIVGGIVFKAFVPLLPERGPAHECRAFIVNGKTVGCWPRSEAAKSIGLPPERLLQSVAENVPSPFASADFGKDVHGRWWLLEVGDGQVSGLPTPDAANAIFRALAPQLR